MNVHWISAVLPLCTLTDRLSPMRSGTDGPLVLFIEEEVDVAQLVCHVIQQAVSYTHLTLPTTERV